MGYENIVYCIFTGIGTFILTANLLTLKWHILTILGIILICIGLGLAGEE